MTFISGYGRRKLWRHFYHSFCSKLPHLPTLSPTLSPTWLWHSDRIHSYYRTCSTWQPVYRPARGSQVILLYSKSKVSWAPQCCSGWLTWPCPSALQTSYYICKREYSQFHCHCLQGYPTALCHLDPWEPAWAVQSRRIGQVSQSRNCIAKRGWWCCSGWSARETRRVICLLHTNLCNLQSFGLSSFTPLLWEYGHS